MEGSRLKPMFVLENDHGHAELERALVSKKVVAFRSDRGDEPTSARSLELELEDGTVVRLMPVRHSDGGVYVNGIGYLVTEPDERSRSDYEAFGG